MVQKRHIFQEKKFTEITWEYENTRNLPGNMIFLQKLPNNMTFYRNYLTI